MFKPGDIVTVNEETKSSNDWANWFKLYHIDVKKWKGKVVIDESNGKPRGYVTVEICAGKTRLFQSMILEHCERQGHPVTKIFK